MAGELLHKEIFEQPGVIERLMLEESDKINLIGREIRGSFDYVLIAARGTSDNAARYAKYLFGERNGITVALAAPSLYTVYQHPPRMEGALVMAISQSGYSPDVISVLQEARSQGCPTIAVTNTYNSPLEGAADHTIYLHAGDEEAVAATKTYTASLAVMAMLSECLHSGEVLSSHIKRLPVWMRTAMEMNSGLLDQVLLFSEMDHCFVISRGYEYATVYEISLKLKELTLTIAEPYSSADFMHGPIALMHPDSYVISIAPPGLMHSDIHQLIIKMKGAGARLLLVADDSELLGLADLAMPIQTGVPDWLFPIVSVLPGQLLALGLAKAKNLDPDHPDGLTKITRTW